MSDERTLYELLGVPRDADAAQISKAWRRRTRKAGPGSPEFTRVNEAAETLLNPDRRTAYDASLPPQQPDPVEPAVTAADGTAAAAGTGGATAPANATAPAKAPAPTRTGRPVANGPAVVVTAVLVVLAIASVVFAVIAGNHKHDASQTDAARIEATAAARQAVGVILAYSYKTMDADLQRDLPYLTPSFAKTFKTNYALLTTAKGGTASPVEQTKTVVTVSVSGAAVMDATPDLVHVLVFADQTTVHKAGPSQQQCPCVLQNRVDVTMVEQGGKWLVNNLQTG